MDLLDQLYTWSQYVLWGALVALRVWAFVDCAIRRAAAFPAVDKLTKPAWLAILLISGLLGTYLGPWDSPSSVVSVFSLASVIVSAIYLADVRPAVREISSGR